MALTPADILQIRTLITEAFSANGIKISALPVVGAISRTGVFPFVDDGATTKMALSQLLTLAVSTVPVSQDLRAMDVDTIADGALFYTTGVGTPGDGGEGPWIYDAASVASDNIGTVIAPDTGVGRFLRQFSGPLNPQWFGASGNGSDQTVAIQNAAGVAEGLGSTLSFPPGIYLLATDTTFGCAIQMQTGARLRVTDADVFVLFNGGFEAPFQYCLDLAGNTRFRRTERIVAQWFGATGLVTDDNTIALQRAFRAVRAADRSSASNNSDADQGCLTVYFPRGVYRCNMVSVFSFTKVVGEVSGSINLSCIQQINRTQPALLVHPKNYGPSDEILNDSNGINTFASMNFRGEQLFDDADNAPVIQHYSPLESTNYFNIPGDTVGGNVGTIDTLYDDCWFQNSPGACVMCDQGNFSPQFFNCTFDVVRSGIEFLGTSTGTLRLSESQFYVNVRRALYVSSSAAVTALLSNNLFRGCGNNDSSNQLYRRGIMINQGGTTLGTLVLDNCTFSYVNLDGSPFGGPVFFIGNSLTIRNCRFIDIDSSDLYKMVVASCDEFRVQNTSFTANSLVDYSADSRLVAFSKADASLVSITGNTVINRTGRTLTAAFQSDFIVVDGSVSDNIIAGDFTSPITSNLSLSRNNVQGNLGFNAAWIYSDVAPVSGDWKVGNIVWNNAPAAAGNIGWVCTADGTPGTWKTFGAITS